MMMQFNPMFKKKEQIMSKLLFLSTAVLGLSSTTLFADGHTQDYSESGYFIFNTLLFLIGGFLVMWMAAGFAMLETGLVRSKNASTQLLKEPCPGKTTLSLDLILFKSEVTSIFTLS